MKIYIIQQWESCDYGEYYGIAEIYKDKDLAELIAKQLSKGDEYMDYFVEGYTINE